MIVDGVPAFAAQARIADSRIAAGRQTSSVSAVAAVAISSTVGFQSPAMPSFCASHRFTAAGICAPEVGASGAWLEPPGFSPELPESGTPDSGTPERGPDFGSTLFDAPPPGFSEGGLPLLVVAAVLESRVAVGAAELQATRRHASTVADVDAVTTRSERKPGADIRATYFERFMHHKRRTQGLLFSVGVLLASGGCGADPSSKAGATAIAPLSPASSRAPSSASRATTLVVKDGTCRASTEDGRRVVECLRADGSRIWGYDEVATPTDQIRADADDQSIVVVRYDGVARGGRVSSYGLATGTPAWQRSLLAAGAPAGASEGRVENAIELRLARGVVRLLGWESGGKYVEQRDAATGALQSLTRERASATGAADPPEPDLASLTLGEDVAFVFDGRSPRWRKALETPTKGGSCTLTLDDASDETHLACTEGGRRVWGVDRAGQFSPGGAIVASDEALYVVDFCAIASGATLDAYDLATGRPRFRRPLYGLGPIDHSKYFNDADVRVEPGERVVVSGWEASGKYVEAVDGRTGAPLGHRPAP